MSFTKALWLLATVGVCVAQVLEFEFSSQDIPPQFSNPQQHMGPPPQQQMGPQQQQMGPPPRQQMGPPQQQMGPPQQQMGPPQPMMEPQMVGAPQPDHQNPQLYQSIWAPAPTVGYAPPTQEYAPPQMAYAPQVGYAPPTQEYAPPPQELRSQQAYAPQNNLDESQLGMFPKKLFKFGLKKPQKYYNTVNYYYPAAAPSYGGYGQSYGGGGYGSSSFGNSGYGSGGCYGGCGGYAPSYGIKKHHYGGGYGGYRSAGLGSPNPMADEEDPMQQQSGLFPMPIETPHTFDDFGANNENNDIQKRSNTTTHPELHLTATPPPAQLHPQVYCECRFHPNTGQTWSAPTIVGAVHQQPIAMHHYIGDPSSSQQPQPQIQNNEVVGGPLQDLTETTFTTPYMGVFDENGFLGHLLKPLEDLIVYLPHVPQYFMDNPEM